MWSGGVTAQEFRGVAGNREARRKQVPHHPPRAVFSSPLCHARPPHALHAHKREASPLPVAEAAQVLRYAPTTETAEARPIFPVKALPRSIPSSSDHTPLRLMTFFAIPGLGENWMHLSGVDPIITIITNKMSLS